MSENSNNDNNVDVEQEESEEDQNEYEKDDFIDDEEYDDYQPSRKHRKRKRKEDRVKKEQDEELDEDDLELINENKSKKKGRKRLMKQKFKAKAELEDEQQQQVYEDEESDGEGYQKQYRDEFIEGDGGDQQQQFGVANEQLDQFNQIFHDSDSDDQEMDAPGKTDQQEDQIHTTKAIEEELGLVTDEEWRNKIAKVDIPERLFVRLKDRLDPTDSELEEEAKWIYSTKKHWKGYHSGEEKIIESINNVLKHFRKNKFDIPFIATYRSYLFQQELQPSDFYEIYEMDLEWDNYLKTRKAIAEKLDEVRPYVPDVDMIDECLALATSNNDLHDIHQFITFYRNTVPELQTKKSRVRDARRKNYSKMIDANIDKFAKEIALKPSDFAKNLRANTLGIKMKRMPTSPSLMAENYKTPKLNSILEFFVNAVSYIADEIAAHPAIRKCVLEKYMQGVKISTKPTEKGEKELDMFHSSYRTKRLKIVPLEKFTDDLWMDIEECKEKGLIEVVFEHEEVLKNIIDWMKALYYEPYPGDRYEKEWQTFYDEIIERVIGVVLKPELEKRAIQELKEKSVDYIVSRMKDTFCKSFLMVPPFLFQKKPCNVISLVVTTAGGAWLTAVHVSEYGELKSHQIFNYLCIPYADKNQTESYEADIGKLKDLISSSRAGLVVIGANCPEARQLKNVLKERIVSDENIVSRLGHEPWVSYGSMEVPQIAAKTPFYVQNMKTLPIAAREAVSLARFKQSPVSETLRLWNEAEKDNMHIFSLNLHPFQKVVPKSKLIESLRNVAVHRVNGIGVDLHATMLNTNLNPCLQFISGLGEIKASDFMRRFLVSESNAMFRMDCTILPPHVHYNAVGFLNASKYNKGGKPSNKKAKALDATRIHPEFYSVATKMARSALDEDQDGAEAISCILRDPSKLRQLDLEQFSQKCESMFGKDYKSIFYFIRDELESPFRDIRGTYSEYEEKMINPEAVFYMLTNESPQTFVEGLYVPVTVSKVVNSDGFACRSIGKSSWSGFISSDNVDAKLQNQLAPGHVVTAKIIKVEYENLSVKLSALSENPTEKEALDRIFAPYRPHFRVVIENDFSMKTMNDAKDRFGPGNRYKARTSYKSYNKFMNVTCSQAVSTLKSKHRGDFIIRPNPRGDKWLNLSLKFYDTQIVHIEIEENKMGDQTEFKIGDLTFSTLQELEIRYIKELNKRVNEVVSNQKFKHFTDMQSFEDYLRGERRRDEKIIPSALTILPDYPQHVVLGYVPSSDISKVVREYIKIKHKGFFFHDKIHNNLIQLISFFKKNYGSRAYRRHVQSKKRKSPIYRLVTNIEQENEEQKEIPNEVSAWTGEAGLNQTPFPAKTNYVGETSQSDWNMSVHPGAKFSSHEKGEESGWGTKTEPNFKREKVKTETGWGDANNQDDEGWGQSSRREKTGWGDDNQNNYSQGSNRSGGSNRGGGFRGRGRGGFRGRGDRGRGDRGRGDRGGDRRGGGDRGCFNCGETGHFARECPDKQDGGFGGGRRRDDRGFGGRDDRGFGGRDDRDDRGFGGRDNWGKNRDNDFGGTKQESGWGADKAGSAWGGNDKGNASSSWGGNDEQKPGSSWGDDKKKSGSSFAGNGNKASSEWGKSESAKDGGTSGWGS